MSKDIWIASDHHFSHANMCKFTNNDGSKVRPWTDVNEMDEAMIESWNSVVKEWDKIYHLGDFSMGFKELPGKVIGRLNGRKRLVRGNHDMCPTSEYMKYFEDIYGVRVFSDEKMIFSHIPLNKDCLFKRKKPWLNVHGHLHSNTVKDKYGNDDSQYFNVSVERINYTPIHIDELITMADNLDQ